MLPVDLYSMGKTTRLQVLTYAGQGKIITTTAVRLNLNGFMVKLSAIDADLNDGSAYSFPTPPKWRACTGKLKTSHSGQVSILLGSDNHLVFPKEEKRDDEGAALWRSIITPQAITDGSIGPEIITWIDPVHKFNINTICIQSFSIHNIQEQLLPTLSAENFSDPSTSSPKRRASRKLCKTQLWDKVDNKVLVHFLYNMKLPDLGENFFGTTRRIQSLHNK